MSTLRFTVKGNEHEVQRSINDHIKRGAVLIKQGTYEQNHGIKKDWFRNDILFKSDTDLGLSTRYYAVLERSK